MERICARCSSGHSLYLNCETDELVCWQCLKKVIRGVKTCTQCGGLVYRALQKDPNNLLCKSCRSPEGVDASRPKCTQCGAPVHKTKQVFPSDCLCRQCRDERYRATISCSLCGRRSRIVLWLGEGKGVCDACYTRNMLKNDSLGLRQRENKHKFDHEMIRAHYRRGESGPTIARAIGCSRETVRKVVTLSGDNRSQKETFALRPKRPAREKRYAYHELLTREEWHIAYWDDEMPTMAMLAERLGIHHMVVYDALVYHNVPTRSRSEGRWASYRAGRISYFKRK